MSQSNLDFVIGNSNWSNNVRSFTDQFDAGYWQDFRPCSISEIRRCERYINRLLPADFIAFLEEIGAGRFPARHGGDIYTPDEICLACSSPVRMVLKTARLASREDHQQFYITRGAFNPLPTLYTSATLQHNGVNLLDLVQIGTDGMSRYHELHVGSEPKPFGYCLLAPGGIYEQPLASFSDFLYSTIKKHRAASTQGE